MYYMVLYSTVQSSKFTKTLRTTSKSALTYWQRGRIGTNCVKCAKGQEVPELPKAKGAKDAREKR